MYSLIVYVILQGAYGPIHFSTEVDYPTPLEECISKMELVSSRAKADDTFSIVSMECVVEDTVPSMDLLEPVTSM